MECALTGFIPFVLQDANLIEVIEVPGVPVPPVTTTIPSPPETPPPPVSTATEDVAAAVAAKEGTGCSISCGCWEVVKVS